MVAMKQSDPPWLVISINTRSLCCSYGNTYGDSLSGLQSNSGYGKNSYGQQSDSQPKSNTTSNTAGEGSISISIIHPDLIN
jgi:hypothetical protein